MSLYDYTAGQRLYKFCLEHYVSFNAVIQCAMRMADTDNTERLKEAWPEVSRDLKKRYDVPGGQLPGD